MYRAKINVAGRASRAVHGGCQQCGLIARSVSGSLYTSHITPAEANPKGWPGISDMPIDTSKVENEARAVKKRKSLGASIRNMYHQPSHPIYWEPNDYKCMEPVSDP